MNRQQQIEQLASRNQIIAAGVTACRRGVAYQDCLEMMVLALAGFNDELMDIANKSARSEVPSVVITVKTKEQFDQIAEQFNVENQERSQ